jgi:hypothetical protein
VNAFDGSSPPPLVVGVVLTPAVGVVPAAVGVARSCEVAAAFGVTEVSVAVIVAAPALLGDVIVTW